MAKLFFAQILAATVAALVFRFGLEPKIAGVLAGTGFLVVGFYGVVAALRARTRGLIENAVLLISLVHVFLVAIPMLYFRISNWDQPFSKVAVWGLAGPDFHVLSTQIYGVWSIVTMVATRKSWQTAKRAKLEKIQRS